jgi:MoxR-like ATPase
VKDVAQLAHDVTEQVGSVIVGKDDQVGLLLVALLTEGHVVIDDVPGVAKTLLVKTLAAALGLKFTRVQCTPDLLPGDVTGSEVFNQKTAAFEFRPGPVFANFVLADEINRATPRTQSSFLEAMEERQVTVEGAAHPLPRPFLVMATQNPVELKGTFPLPEAQLDRFLMKLRLGYPTQAEEVRMLARFRNAEPLADVRAVASVDDILAVRDAAREVHVSDDIESYIVAIVRATRETPTLTLGASPRAALMLMHAAQARAVLAGRDFVTPDDVAALAAPVLAHRLLLARDALIEQRDPAAVVAGVLAGIAAPVEEAGGRRA